ncbi:MAG: hypothetical protein UV59_C0029G0010 [Candidatus Gottesmanbacteria bacterium GW2011_GWA1_43_11]|uniref:Uncharacterized protein n=1 Tax=Candidatus Gottesmanbacteria bacterium GW2011_GWA1_43_11 TaxID=1618436 RepID=A0A0G1FAQ1_9BACT|nr:MAG: hypothetical protein UV59_C0029G0010 [Candidatus Gottesmanbacteria bacterium GW2011_GWA1_43_11]
MKKIVLAFFLLVSVLSIVFPKNAQAQTFYCEWNGAVAGVLGSCTAVASCGANAIAEFPDGKTCEWFTTKFECNLHNSSAPQTCIAQPYCNPSRCPAGCTQNTLEGGDCINYCIPGTRACGSNNTILECTPDGSSFNTVENCAASGQICNQTSKTCITPPYCLAFSAGDPSCFTDCLNCGQTQSQCATACQSTGSIPTGSGTANIINLDTLIASIGLNNECLADASGVIRLGSIISCLLPYVYAFAGVGLLLFLMAAGFSYLTSAGDAKKAEAAKGKLTAAVIGFIIIVVAFWVTQIVNTVFKLGSGV